MRRTAGPTAGGDSPNAAPAPAVPAAEPWPTSPCPDCGKPVVIAIEDPDAVARPILLDPKALVFLVERMTSGKRHARRSLTALVLHERTCRAAGRPPAAPHEQSTQGYTTAPCRSCNAPVIFAESDKGARIPLDAAAEVYLVERRGELVRACRTHVALVTHFATCPTPERFSGKATR